MQEQTKVRIDSLAIGAEFVDCNGTHWTFVRWHKSGCVVACSSEGIEDYFSNCAMVTPI